MSGPRFVLPARLETLKESSIVQYRRAADKFIAYLDREQYVPHNDEEWDDLLVKFYYQERLSPSSLRLVLASIEFGFPRFKGQLKWAHSTLEAAISETPPKHAAPAGRDACLLLGCTLLSLGRPRIGG